MHSNCLHVLNLPLLALSSLRLQACLPPSASTQLFFSSGTRNCIHVLNMSVIALSSLRLQACLPPSASTQLFLSSRTRNCLHVLNLSLLAVFFASAGVPASKRQYAAFS
jgi:hypothetical protein